MLLDGRALNLFIASAASFELCCMVFRIKRNLVFTKNSLRIPAFVQGDYQVRFPSSGHAATAVMAC